MDFKNQDSDDAADRKNDLISEDDPDLQLFFEKISSKCKVSRLLEVSFSQSDNYIYRNTVLRLKKTQPRKRPS
jgi:hypothetical protein